MDIDEPVPMYSEIGPLAEHPQSPQKSDEEGKIGGAMKRHF